MSSTRLYRASGLALLLGALLTIIGNVFNTSFFSSDGSHLYLNSFWSFVQVLSILGEMLLLLGVPGVCVYQARRAGWPGFVGFILTFIGGFLLTSFSITSLLVDPWIAQVAPQLLAQESGPQAVGIFLLLASIIYGLGGIVLGIATIRAGDLPRGTGLLLIIGVMLTPINFLLNGIIASIVGIVAFILFSLAFGWMGFSLVTTRSVREVQTVPAT